MITCLTENNVQFSQQATEGELLNLIRRLTDQAKKYNEEHIVKTKDSLEAWNKAIKNISMEPCSNYIRYTHMVILSAW